jgi:hypothetical protein
MFKPKTFIETFKPLLKHKLYYNPKELERLLGYALVDGRIIEDKDIVDVAEVNRCIDKFMKILGFKESKYFYEIGFDGNEKFEGFTYICRPSVYLPTVLYDWKRNRFFINSVAGYVQSRKTRFELKLPLTG